MSYDDMVAAYQSFTGACWRRRDRAAHPQQGALLAGDLYQRLFTPERLGILWRLCEVLPADRQVWHFLRTLPWLAPHIRWS
jgi:hypothetical protein